MKKLFTLFSFLILHAAGPYPAGAQPKPFSFRYDAAATVREGERLLANPWAGGINSAQYSRIHLNDDAIEDLLLFDRQSNRVMTFVAEAAGGGYRWRYAPGFESQFPALQAWVLLVDYDGDGKRDLFTHAPSGLRIFRNTGQNGRLTWQSVADPVYAEGLSSRVNLYIVSADVPSITDADDDGDVDIAVFDLNGNTALYFQNMSVERSKGKGGLEFKRVGLCWGNFQKEECNDFIFGVDCRDPSGGRLGKPSGARPMHAGNAMLMLDLNGDNKKDLLLGHITCQNLARLNNSGGNGSATRFTTFTPRFPEKDPVQFDIFPAPFLEDVDFDGRPDLLASPNVSVNEGSLINFRESNWFYRNEGTREVPDFRLVQKNFLQDGMIDLGENAAPALADLDGDGDADLLVGNAGVRGERGFRASIAFYENTGTAAQAAFTLRTADYLNLSGVFQLTNLQPMLADVDGNGSLDLIFAGISINRRLEIRCLLNQAPRGAAVRFEAGSVLTLPAPDRLVPGDAVTWTDLSGDGRADMLIGKAGGLLEYHRNTGTGSTLTFALQQADYGKLFSDQNNFNLSPAVTDLNADGRPELLIGNGEGRLHLYSLPEQSDGAARLLDSALIVNDLLQTPETARPGGGLKLAVADLNGDGLPDLLAGTGAGGLRFLRNTSEKALVTSVEPTDRRLWAYPNPTSGYVRLRPTVDGQVDVFDVGGRRVLTGLSVRAGQEAELDLSQQPAGVYLIRLRTERGEGRTLKVVVGR